MNGQFWSMRLFVIVFGIAIPGLAHGQNAPSGLRGKSIIISWSEHRSQRQGYQTTFIDVTLPVSMKIYVSTIGRPFSSLNVTSRGGDTGSSQAVGSTANDRQAGERQITFQGRAMVMLQGSRAGLARRIMVDFNESFASCKAQVIFAKETGSAIVTTRNLNTGQRMEIRSASITGVSCSVRGSNVFAE
jgi:hypothetical protein